MIQKSTSFWPGLYLLSLAIPVTLTIPSTLNVSASTGMLTSQSQTSSYTANAYIAGNVGGALAKELQGKPVVVDIYASWCSKCKNIAPTLSQLKKQYQGKAHFIVLDVTNKTKVSESEVKAKKLGLGEFLAKNKSQTGSVTIISPGNGKILAEYRNNTNLSDYTSVLNSAISQR
ncbi:redoxin domain-containing protein [Cylindrospermopsis raciborskii CHAB3438]|uniref:thioredoxin domain-containing protein n=1 Tax=Cylindrospermopsis raciborskii TaxID=77022 RepID=UPI001F0D2DFA|nr:thioredoxin domain-containing protein [Cylindrospermopsis raciborskii]MCH4903434.1 redoxin domain-containing protein [Cylindrospermopsis raciborskii CHAB3438]